MVKLSDKQFEAFRRDGRAAFCKGWDILDCPWPFYSEERLAWFAGWLGSMTPMHHLTNK